jgi:hypothetical protein
VVKHLRQPNQLVYRFSLALSKKAVLLQSQTAIGPLDQAKENLLAVGNVSELCEFTPCLSARPLQHEKIIFLHSGCKIKKKRYLCTPFQPEAARQQNERRKAYKYFLLKSCQVKKFAYLCTPNRRKGLQAARKELVT